MTESVLIALPLPHSCLSPNRPPGSIGGRMRKAAAAKKHRKLARLAVEAQGVESGPWSYATIAASFFHKTNRRRDDINSLAMLKAAYDGIVDSGLLEDDDGKHLESKKPSFAVDKKHPRVELLIERVE